MVVSFISYKFCWTERKVKKSGKKKALNLINEVDKVKSLNKETQIWQRPTFPQGDPAVLSAMKCLTSRFGMELGMTTSL